MTLRQYLVTVSVTLVLLLCVAAALLIHQVDSFRRAQGEAQLLQTTQALSSVVDSELARYEAILQALRTSDALARGDWSAFDRQARQVLAGPSAWIVVGDREGRQLVNTRLPAGSALPKGSLPAAVWSLLDQGSTHVCNLSEGLVANRILCVDLPIVRSGRAEYHLSVIFLPEETGRFVAQQRLQEGSFATVLDRNGIVVWRNVGAERFIGQPATADVREALKYSSTGVQESTSLEGVPTIAAFSRSARTGWTFVVALPRASVGGASGATIVGATAAVLALLALGAFLGLLAARRIANAISSLATAAGPSGAGELAGLIPSGLTDVDAVGAALASARRSLQETEERYRRVFEQTSDLIIIADLDQVITDCNPAAAAAVGLARDEAVGRGIAEFIAPADFERTSQKLRQKIEHGGTTRYDVQVRSRSGEWLYWEINSGLIQDPFGAPVGLHVVGRDITERRRFEDHQRLLVNELNHRVKNTLAIVQSLAQQSFKSLVSPEEARRAFDARLTALAAAHNLLTRQSWEKASLKETLSAAIAATAGDRSSQVELRGPDLALAPQTAVSVAMAAHELCTNAIKYGALSLDAGRVSVHWEILQSGEEPRLHLEWEELGGPPVEAPKRKGFGSKLIERGLSSELRGTVKLEFLSSGVRCTLNAPLPTFGGKTR
ncbi:MAG TPA: HWE histidine kinase domain-containing protein [Allosphingosinicella sp.]|nr:HWE histidine kinase domain-containing protein [Allosphingosinicella sp.]